MLLPPSFLRRYRFIPFITFFNLPPQYPFDFSNAQSTFLRRVVFYGLTMLVSLELYLLDQLPDFILRSHFVLKGRQVLQDEMPRF